jgi:hypothetical protein
MRNAHWALKRKRDMRWVLSLVLLALFALAAACSAQKAEPSLAPAQDAAATITVYKSPT